MATCALPQGHMTDDELDEALSELEDTRTTAEEELAVIRGRKETLEDLERDRDALLESYAQMTPGALDTLTPEERRQVYGMLHLEVDVYADGRMVARGVLSENVCQAPLHVNGHAGGDERLCENGLAHLCMICSGCMVSGRPKRA